MPWFLTNEELTTRYDWRWLAQNLVEGTTITGAVTPPTLTDLTTFTVVAGVPVYTFPSGQTLQTLIGDASDQVMGAAAIGDRYTADDLTTYGGNLLKWLTAGVTLGGVLKRRVRASDQDAAFSKAYAEALEYLELLRRGERIFYAVPDVPEAGLPGTAGMIPQPGSGPPYISQNARIFGCTTANQRWPWGWGG